MSETYKLLGYLQGFTNEFGNTEITNSLDNVPDDKKHIVAMRNLLDEAIKTVARLEGTTGTSLGAQFAICINGKSVDGAFSVSPDITSSPGQQINLVTAAILPNHVELQGRTCELKALTPDFALTASAKLVNVAKSQQGFEHTFKIDTPWQVFKH